MYNSLDQFELEIINHIKADKINLSLSLIMSFVESIVNDSRTITKVYGSATLDRLCQLIGAEVLKHQQSHIIKNELLDNCSIYIATELYDTGGHTAVIEDFIKATPNKQHLILITDTSNTAQRDVIENRFASLEVKIKWAPSENSLDKLIWLQSELIEQQGNQVFLFNHWQDAVAVAAVQPSITPKLFFYHHCDHQFCLGLYLSHAKHIDLHSFGYYNCRKNLRVTNNIYIPLAIEDLGTRPVELPFCGDGKLRTCSSGSYKKFENPYLYSYLDEIPQIINSTQGVHVHIGRLTTYVLNRIHDSLKKCGIPQDRFVYVPWVKSLWKAMHEQRVDVYISSFPIAGARASIEIMGSGTPMIGHNNYHSRLLGGVDIIYPEAFFWQKPQELHNYLQSLTPDVLREQSIYSRSQYERFHTMSVLESSLKQLDSQDNGLIPEPLKPHLPNQVQAFLDEITLDESKQFIDIIDAIHPILAENKLKLDKNKASSFLYWLTTSYAKLQASKLAVENIQNEKASLQSKLNENQAKLEVAQTQIQNTQTKLEISQTQIQNTQNQLEVSQIHYQNTYKELELAQAQLQSTQQELIALRLQFNAIQEEISTFTKSKFWHLRANWLKIKKLFGS
jgi:hypothetical protein